VQGIGAINPCGFMSLIDVGDAGRDGGDRVESPVLGDAGWARE
jgi:hypothetical protein